MVLVNYTWLFIVLFCAFRKANGEVSQFRILAPEIVCPKDENTVIEKPDYIVITLQTEADDLKFSWTVGWVYLEAPTQRFTLLLWRTVRALEAQLNAPQPDPFAFIINNTQLLGGVDYIFNITSTQDSEDNNGTTKSFHIDNIKGDQKLIVDGRSDKFSVFLVGGIKIFTDMEYLLVAEVTTCSPVQDYYFAWSIEASGNIINVDDISGWRLEIPPYTLQAGEVYYVTCRVYRNSSLVTQVIKSIRNRRVCTKNVIKVNEVKEVCQDRSGDPWSMPTPLGNRRDFMYVIQTELPFQVLYRELSVHLNVDILFVTINKAFAIEAIVENYDYYGELLTFSWSCEYQDRPCEDFKSSNDDTLLLSRGLSQIGQYEIIIFVTVRDQNATAKTKVTIVKPVLPVIQIQLHSRVVNERSNISLIANASNVAPSCILTWYFATSEYLASLGKDECDDCQHGETLSDSLTIFSLEENFLNEISDFTNETEWRQVSTQIEATEGRARFVAECGCSLTFNCKTEGMVYADISFQLNPGPIVADLKVSPDVGTAMETVFRISKISASDPDKPLLYTLLCNIKNDEIIVLGSNFEHLAVDTFLPFVGTGTDIWAEVCDSLGACSKSNVVTIQLSAGEARSLELLLEFIRGYVLRCELMLLNQIVRSTVVTYMNAKQNEALSTFTNSLLKLLPAEDHCLKNHQEYLTLLHWLASQGIDTTSFE